MTRRLLTAALLATLAMVVVFGLNLWLTATERLTGWWLSLVLVTELLVLLALVWGVYAMLAIRVFNPLQVLQQRQTVSTDPQTAPSLPRHHYLGDLPAQLQALNQSLARARDQIVLAQETAADRSDQRRARLQAILDGLNEGVIVCALDHGIELFNRSAETLGRCAGQLGLQRPVTSLFRDDEIPTQLQALLDQFERDPGSIAVAEFGCRLAGDREARVTVRMSLILEPDSTCAGYVLCLVPKGLLKLEHAEESRAGAPRRRPYEPFDQPLANLDFVVFDVETTGLNPSADEIVQLAAVRVVNGRLPERDHLELLVNPGLSIPRQAIRVHGITDEMVRNAATVCDAVARFHDFSEHAVLVAHNTSLNLQFLKHKEQTCGYRFDHPVLDTLLLSFVLQPGHTTHTLDAIAARHGLDIPPGARRTALGDARITAQVLLAMLEALARQDIRTLRRALDASNQVFQLHRAQEWF